MTLSVWFTVEYQYVQVIMRRAYRKLRLSHNIIGEDTIDRGEKEMEGVEGGDLRSIVLGLQMLDPTDMSKENSDKVDMSEFTAMSEKVIAFRKEQKLDKLDKKFEINCMDIVNGSCSITEGVSDPVDLDPIEDENSYQSWIEKFKEVLLANNTPVMELGSRRRFLEENHLKAEAARKRAEEKKLSKWEALGYHSLSVKDPVFPDDKDIKSDSGSVHFVYGDCTLPSKVCPSEPTVIFRYACPQDSTYIKGLFLLHQFIRGRCFTRF